MTCLRSISPVQLGGPFQLCNWIGLPAPSVRLSDQRRVRCTLPRQRLCEGIYTQLSRVCQGSDCTTQLLLYSCNEPGRLTGTKKGRFLADKRPTNPYSIDRLSDVIWPSCVLAHCLPCFPHTGSPHGASRVPFNLTLIPELFTPQKLTQTKQLFLGPELLTCFRVCRSNPHGHQPALRFCPGGHRHTGRLAAYPSCFAVWVVVV